MCCCHALTCVTAGSSYLQLGCDLETCCAVNPSKVRVGFHGGKDVWTRDVLNLGVSPARLIATVRAKFEAAGGLVLENTGVSGVTIHPQGAAIALGGPPPQSAAAAAGGGGSAAQQAPRVLTTRLLLDCMGHASPIVRQLRWGVKPDGICLVVGGLASGFDPAANTTGDVIFTHTPLQPPGAPVSNAQYFWEAFPAGSGPTDRTTYM